MNLLEQKQTPTEYTLTALQKFIFEFAFILFTSCTEAQFKESKYD